MPKLTIKSHTPYASGDTQKRDDETHNKAVRNCILCLEGAALHSSQRSVAAVYRRAADIISQELRPDVPRSRETAPEQARTKPVDIQKKLDTVCVLLFEIRAKAHEALARAGD
jgi:hypothetical protein